VFTLKRPKQRALLRYAFALPLHKLCQRFLRTAPDWVVDE